MNILVDADRMKIVSGEMRTTIDTLRYNMDSLELLINSLSGEWQGDAEKAYASKIIYVRNEFKAVENFFEEFATFLSQFSEDYLLHEDELAMKIQNV